jgi:hypothetical protein
MHQGWLSSHMKNGYLKAVSLTVVLLIVCSLVPIGRTEGQSQDTVVSFLLLNHNRDITYQLNVSIPYSLYQYYTIQNHFLFSPSDFSRFVTAYTLKPIADRLWQIYNNTEDFTNGVLGMVHQITYKETIPGKYPVETLVAGTGDCDLFAYIAASILEAAGVPTVLLYYKEQEHMQIAVDIGSEPVQARNGVYSITYQNVSYYIAECTGGNWRWGWRVGECPADYQNATSQVITLDKMEQTSIGQVGASLRELDPSTLALQVSSSLMLENSPIVISGQILPQTPNENVTLQAKINSADWSTIATVETQPDGSFTYSWMPPSGTIDIQANWEGNKQYNGATSTKNSVFVMPYIILALIITLIVGITLLLMVFTVTRQRRSQTPAFMPLGIPSEG